MPSPTTIDEFLELVRKSGVVEEKKLTAHLDRLRAAPPLPGEPTALAGVLVRDGLLTHFQAEQLLQGKWRRFSIGKYKVLERLGAGGMGSVYLCEHKLMRRRVALKVLPTAKAEDPSSLERFYREARAVAALDHPNIVRAYDIDQEDKLHFLVMEHVDGSSLQEIIKKTGPMDLTRTCHYIRQAALGLQHAHEAAGLVHRDIKPGNILVDRNGIVKVLDMGLARFFHDEEDILTKKYDENVLGTADYLAPEQALDSHGVDIRADVYSLGATFYFCLTGRTPFAEGTVAQKLIWHQTRHPKPLRTLRPELPEEVAAIVEKMMAKDPSQRYQTPQAVADALAPWTQTPIPAPPDEEMPQFSLAAMGGPTAEASVTARLPLASEPSPVPRKALPVPAAPTAPLLPAPTAPLPPPLPAAPASAAAAPAAPSKTRPGPPPSAPLAPPPPAPPRIPATPAAAPGRPPSPSNPDLSLGPPRKTTPPPARPPVAAPPAPTAATPAPAANGRLPPSEAVSRPAPPPAEEEIPVWGKLATDTDDPTARVDTAPHTTRRPAPSGRKRIPPLPTDRRRLRWLVGGAALAASLLVAVLIWVALRLEPDAQRPFIPARPIFFISKSGKSGTLPRIRDALQRIQARPGLGGRIILQQDWAEEVQFDNLPNVTIEGEEGKAITWKAPGTLVAQRLLMVSRSPDFRLKNLTLNGEKREEALLLLTLACPGLVLENVTFKGILKYGIWIANCEGGDADGRQVSLQDLTFFTEAGQTALFFDVTNAVPAIPKDRNITVRNCKFEGPGIKIRVSDPAKLDRVTLPADIPPVVGR